MIKKCVKKIPDASHRVGEPSSATGRDPMVGVRMKEEKGGGGAGSGGGSVLPPKAKAALLALLVQVLCKLQHRAGQKSQIAT